MSSQAADLPTPHLASLTPCSDRGANTMDITEELSEEDQQLKNELEMLVERLKVRG